MTCIRLKNFIFNLIFCDCQNFVLTCTPLKLAIPSETIIKDNSKILNYNMLLTQNTYDSANINI